jgi:phosphonate transport system ATP-binding protein
MAQPATTHDGRLLDVTGLGKTYQSRGTSSGQKALSGIDFSVEPGELVTVIGPSGAGKSTLLRCINRLIEPTEGTVRFLGEDITHLKRRSLRPIHRQIAMIFQNYNLVYRLTAIQNVLHGRLGYKGSLAGSLGLYSEEEKVRAFEILDEVGLGEFAYRRADQLSGGQKQRVGIARALIQDPKIILCDEPIASLDPKSSRVVMEQLRSLSDRHGITCIVNLHQVDFALEFSDRIVGLHAGEKVFEGTPDRVTKDIVNEIYGDDDEAFVDVPMGTRDASQDAGAQAGTPLATPLGGAQ